MNEMLVRCQCLLGVNVCLVSMYVRCQCLLGVNDC